LLLLTVVVAENEWIGSMVLVVEARGKYGNLP
jgi:hypothetical protein